VPFAALPDFALVVGSYDVTYIHRRTMNERATHTRRQVSAKALLRAPALSFAM
jgi:hypothetical protein